MIRLVVFGEAITYPPKDGISAHVYGLLRSLSDNTIIKPILVVADRGYVTAAQYERMPWEVFLVPPDSFYDYDYMAGLLKDIQPNIIQSYDVYQARLIATRYSQEYNIPLVMEHHDIEAIRADFLTLPEGIGAKNAAAQKEVAQFAALNRVMSRYDYEYLTKLVPNRNDHFICMPVSIKNDFVDMPTPTHRSTRDILFVGNGAYPPNNEAMRYIIEKLAPRMPKYTFHIVGRHSDTLVTHVTKNVIGYGMVDDLSTLAQKCFCGIAPLATGSGMKIKVLTYASAHLPVIATPVALQGFENEDFYIPAELNSFHLAIQDLSAAANLLSLSNAAHAHYLDIYSPDKQCALLVKHYAHLVTVHTIAPTPLVPISRDDSRLFWLHEERNENLTITNELRHYNGVTG